MLDEQKPFHRRTYLADHVALEGSEPKSRRKAGSGPATARKIHAILDTSVTYPISVRGSEYPVKAKFAEFLFHALR